MAGEELERTELEAVLETRRELGLRYDAELVEGFAERIEAAVDRRVADEVSARHAHSRAAESAGKRQTALGVLSLISFVPIGIPLGLNGQLPSLLITVLGIVGVNVAHAHQSRPRQG